MVAAPAFADADRARIAEAVAQAETLTGVELRLVLAHCSSHYGEFELIYPMVVALIGGGIVAAARPALPAVWLFATEAAVFAVAALALQWPALRRALVPSAVKRKKAWKNARLHYASIGLQNLHTGNALLLFCSAAERYVEILVDEAIAQALPESVWTPIVERFKTQFAQGAAAEAFATAAQSCAAALAGKFPRRPGAPNAIPNLLVET